ncbi:MAG TPA: regulatory protein RecX [Candidatus Woesebacteria bacterium]|nr:regulatory protein RecX [Candidatus Woesebacteria bacterium]
MIIDNIKKTPGFWWFLILEDQLLPITVDQVVAYHLAPGKDISSTDLEKLINESFFYKSKLYCLYQLGLSPKSKKILIRKLKLKISNYLIKYPLYHQVTDQNLVIEKIVDDLESQKLFNEADYVSQLINRHHRLSRQAIIAKLRQNGVDINQYRSLINQVDDSLSINQTLAKKIQTIKDPTSFTAKKRLFDYLVRKGFAYDEAKKAIDEQLKNS